MEPDIGEVFEPKEPVANEVETEALKQAQKGIELLGNTAKTRTTKLAKDLNARKFTKTLAEKPAKDLNAKEATKTLKEKLAKEMKEKEVADIKWWEEYINAISKGKGKGKGGFQGNCYNCGEFGHS